MAFGNDTTQRDGRERSASVLRRLVLLAIPTFGQLVAEPAFVLVDTAIVGHVGTSALAGLSLGSTVVLTAVGLCIFLAYATTSQVSRFFGAGRRREGLQAAVDSLWLALLLGVVLATVIFACAEPLCFALGGRGEVLAQAVVYTRTVVLGVPGMLLVYASNGLFRGLQKVRITLVVAVAGAVLNTALDLVLVVGLGWGVGGSGFATFVAQWFMAVCLLVPALRWVREDGVSLKPRASGLRAVGGDGLPLFLRTLALRVALVATVMAAASLGEEALAAYQVVNAGWNFVLNILDSVAIAAQALVGAAIGAGERDGARSITRIAARAGLGAGVVLGVLFALAGFVAAPLFSPSVAVQHLVAVGMVAAGVGLPLEGWMWALDGILIGAGDFRYLAKACALVSAAYLLALGPLAWLVFPVVGGAAGTALLWVAFGAVLMGGRALANGLRVRGDRWMAQMARRALK